MSMETQETRTERQTLALTPTEVNDARLVAAFRNTDLSVLLREERMKDIQAEAEKIRSYPLQSTG